MTTINVNLRDDYCPDWGLHESLREFIQNALDAHDDGHEMRLSRVDGHLFIANANVTLSRDVWLMGHTTKRGGKSKGGHGEGLKIGALAAVRAGHRIRIFSGNEAWEPFLAEDEQWHARTLKVRVATRGDIPDGNLIVEIYDVNDAAWDKIKARFLALDPPADAWHDPIGSVMTERRGLVYARGILVQEIENLVFGYDLKMITIDRDRKWVDRMAAQIFIARLLAKMAEQHADAVEKTLIPLLEQGAPDADYLGTCLSKATRQAIAAAFKKRYGEFAIAVTTSAEAKEAEHYGRIGVVLPERYVRLISDEIGNLGVHRQNSTRVTQIYTGDELTPVELTNWHRVLAIVEAASASLGYDQIGPRTTIVDFADPSLFGTHSATKEIQIARKNLASEEFTRDVLVHEVAHDRGDDATADHRHAEGALHSRIEQSLLDAIRKAAGVI